MRKKSDRQHKPKRRPASEGSKKHTSATIKTRTRSRVTSPTRASLSIFTVDSRHLEQLGAKPSVEFVRGLLWGEARRIGLPATQISISSWIDVSDGGIDAAVEDNGSTIPSTFLHRGHTGYQIKAGREFEPWKDSHIRSTLFGKGNLPRREKLGTSIRACLERNGTYVLVCTGIDLPRRQELAAGGLLRKYFIACGYPKSRVDVWSQNKLIGLLQRFPSLSLDVNGRSHVKFQTHRSWSQNADMRPALKTGPAQQAFIDALQSSVRTTDAAVHVRVLGDAGIGKTRLVLEATSADDLRPLVVYSSSGAAFRDSDLLNELLRDDNEFAAIVVLDECDRGTSAEIWNRLRSRGSRIKLISIHNEFEPLSAGDTQYLDAPELEKSQIAEILREYGVPDDQIDRWAEQCGGSPRMAHMLGGNLKSNPKDLLREPDTSSVYDRSIVGREDAHSERVEQRRTVLKHLALFKRFGYSGGGLEAEAKAVAAIVKEANPGITWARFQEIIRDLRQRKILQGEATLYITPKLLHIKLWVDYWETYGNGFDIEAFLARLSEKLKEWFLEMFAYAAESRTATEIVEGLLGPAGLFQRTDFLDHPLGSRFFRALAEAHPGPALECLRRTIGTWDRDRLLHFGEGRRHIVLALQGIAMWQNLFPGASRLLLQLGEAENETWANSASGVFADLFSPAVGRVAPTEAPPDERFPVLAEALASDVKERRALALKAADHALESQHFSRSVGPEYQGLRVVPKLWTPQTWGELFDSYRRVWELLEQRTETLTRKEQEEATTILFKRARGLGRYPNLFEMVINTLTRLSTRPYVDRKELIGTIEGILHYEGKNLPTEGRRRWKELRDSLVGEGYHSLMQRYVGMDILEDEFDDDGNIVENKIEPIFNDLAERSIREPETLDAELSWLVTNAAKNGYRFAYALGKRDSGFSLLSRLLEAQRGAGDGGSAYFLGGYFRAILETDNSRWEEVLDDLVGDDQLLKWVPEITWRSGPLSDRAATRVVSLAEANLVPAAALGVFAFGSVTRALSVPVFHRWIEFLLRVGDLQAISIALELFHFYYEGKERPRHLPKELTAQLIMAPALFQKADSRNRHDRINWEWAQVAKTFIRSYPGAAAQVANLMLEHFGEDGTIVEGFHSQPQGILDEIMRQNPRETWRAIQKYLGPPIDARAYHITSWLRGDDISDGATTGVIALVPREELWRWVDEDVEKRAWYLATFVPKSLTRTGVCLAREVLIRYGERDDVRSNLMANFSTEGWSGPESLHYQGKRAWLLGFRKDETNANVKRWIDEYVSGLDSAIARARITEERRHF